MSGKKNIYSHPISSDDFIHMRSGSNNNLKINPILTYLEYN